ncbi:DoxX family protein [Hymenobacter roseosalivarius DSM 11622]|uniref:DoxX family protein n=1 Tax=Hymenobacter roseosalivarius DSM 11622 TaxID=645990 RepID=A0A1W1W4D2_9BACT|nr:DoxX family protein [Hymenobacter roseosalivarius]SMC00502.1 DoxX family protein [Hymenobacter roseosalivarius DSM 11622]
MKNLLFSATPLSSRLADVTWLLLRLHIGLSIAIGAGWSKLVNMTTATEAAKLAGDSATLGPPDWFVQQVANLGFTYPSPYTWAWLAVWGEFAGGLLIAFGLLTRWGAVQLAFQFFVIAFLWYESPEPVLGMYYQQLLFWCFVLVTVVGGGRYSLDYALTHPTGWLRRLVPTH